MIMAHLFVCWKQWKASAFCNCMNEHIENYWFTVSWSLQFQWIYMQKQNGQVMFILLLKFMRWISRVQLVPLQRGKENCTKSVFPIVKSIWLLNNILEEAAKILCIHLKQNEIHLKIQSREKLDYLMHLFHFKHTENKSKEAEVWCR